MKRLTYNSFSSLGWFNLFWIVCVLGYWFFVSPKTYLSLAYVDHKSPVQGGITWTGFINYEDVQTILSDNYSPIEVAHIQFNHLFTYNFDSLLNRRGTRLNFGHFYLDNNRKLLGVAERDSVKALKLLNSFESIANGRYKELVYNSVNIKYDELKLSRLRQIAIYDSLFLIHTHFKQKSLLFNSSRVIQDTLNVLESALAINQIRFKSINDSLYKYEEYVSLDYKPFELIQAPFSFITIRPNLLVLLIVCLTPLNTLWFLFHLLFKKFRL